MTTEQNDDLIAADPIRTYTRRSDQARYDAQSINSALDEALICHVGYVDGEDPVVIPAIHARVGEDLFLRVPTDSRLAQLAVGGTQLCVTVTLLDGLVLARSEVNTTLNYRSVVARGRGTLLVEESQKQAVLDYLVEHLVAGRARHSRPPAPAELAALAVIRMPLEDVALKSRSGPPADEDSDLALHHWAGVIGVRNGYGPAFPAPDLPYNQREEDGGSLVFDTDVLTERCEILGSPKVRLEVSADQPVAMVAARLSDVAPDGRATRVTYGMLNLTHRDSHGAPEPLEPGEHYKEKHAEFKIKKKKIKKVMVTGRKK